MFHDQLGMALAMQRASLAEIGTELYGAGLIGLVELHFLEFQFPNTDQHSSTGLSLRTKRPTYPEAPAEPGLISPTPCRSGTG